MSFGAGMGAGMGAGIGAGIAIGVSSGQKKAVEQIRDYIETNQLAIHDRMGKPVPVEQVLESACATCSNKSAQTGWVVAGVLFGLLALGVALAAYLVFL